MTGYREHIERWRHHKPPAARHWPRDPDDLNTHPAVCSTGRDVAEPRRVRDLRARPERRPSRLHPLPPGRGRMTAFLADILRHFRPRRCSLGCGQRVPAIAQGQHEAIEHAGEGL